MPAAICGLIGLKQSHGLVSLRGCMPTGTWTNDHIGPLTRTVDDAALMLSLMQGYDGSDPDSSRRTPSPCSRFGNLNGLTIGIPENYFWDGIDASVETECGAAVAQLERAGARLVPVTFETIDLLQVARPSMMAESYVFHEPYLREHPEDYSEELRYRLLAGQVVLATDYIRARRVRRLWVDEVSAVLGSVDALAMPTVPVPATPIGASSVEVNGKDQALNAPGSSLLGHNTSPFNLAGVPASSRAWWDSIRHHPWYARRRSPWADATRQAVGAWAITMRCALAPTSVDSCSTARAVSNTCARCCGSSQRSRQISQPGPSIPSTSWTWSPTSATSSASSFGRWK
jgi:aspartyl-tRNA(Asn)/glutamyl-tRNA(Gln) amidotransferase subunit A